MRIVIFGASGRTGRELVRRALDADHWVTAAVRTPAKLAVSHSHLRILAGDVTDKVAVERAIAQQDAAICALGSPTPLRRDPTLIEGVGNIIRAMEEQGVRRFVYLSFLGVREGRRGLGFLVEQVVARLLRNPIADHEMKEALIKESRLDWTIVRPPRLTDGPHTGVFRSGEDIKGRSPILTLSRADLADFMLRQLADDTYLRKAPRVLY